MLRPSLPRRTTQDFFLFVIIAAIIEFTFVLPSPRNQPISRAAP
jgi:hypothetical protein